MLLVNNYILLNKFHQALVETIRHVKFIPVHITLDLCGNNSLPLVAYKCLKNRTYFIGCQDS